MQGVGFRAFTLDAAHTEGLDGWVTNRPDGDVEVFAEGDLAAVDRFENRLRRGPRGAHVDSVEITADSPTGRARGFAIVRSPGAIGV